MKHFFDSDFADSRDSSLFFDRDSAENWCHAVMDGATRRTGTTLNLGGYGHGALNPSADRGLLAMRATTGS